ncbi:general transcription factor IIE polypeptide 1 GTF2E1 [Cryptosporidium sp. chipmunk genotype I]|uniref:general transcription factor IIE polypeptide 1 GTF2E1 n=1 Tax=Cryptosporidium sp. chipmunk genotype I TaxID=1280935 RepID=UPI003519DCF1|nr:general transcription factor IIE polypeptide 1 GTF2E1 [Cryptosporidium sp. chipmunk genotype I]
MNKQDSHPNRNNHDTQKFPYNPENFKTFVQILLRLFHDSPAIIVGDCLIREQKSFTDRDLANKLNLSDRQVREALRQLEEDLIVVKDQKSNDGSQSHNSSSDQSSNKNSFINSGTLNFSTDLESKYSSSQGGSGSNSTYYNNSNTGLPSNRIGPSFYRINPYLPAVVEWQYTTIIHEIDQEIKDAVNLDELVCNRCNAKYSSLEALSLDLNPEDGLFLCRFCNEKLKSVDSASFRNAAKDKAERIRSQLQILFNSLELVKNMHIPVFPPYQSKNDANFNKTRFLNSIENDGNINSKIPDDQTTTKNSSNETSTPISIDNTSSPYSNQSNFNVSINQPSSGMKNSNSSSSISSSSSSSPQTLPQSTISKVKFGIKMSAKSTSSIIGTSSSRHSKLSGNSTAVKQESSNTFSSMNLSRSCQIDTNTTKITNNSISNTATDSIKGTGQESNHHAPLITSFSTKSPTKIEEPTFSVSAIKDKVFKITEIDDDIINQMTDTEYLKYDELLQQYQTLGLINI